MIYALTLSQIHRMTLFWRQRIKIEIINSILNN